VEGRGGRDRRGRPNQAAGRTPLKSVSSGGQRRHGRQRLQRLEVLELDDGGEAPKAEGGHGRPARKAKAKVIQFERLPDEEGSSPEGQARFFCNACRTRLHRSRGTTHRLRRATRPGSEVSAP